MEENKIGFVKLIRGTDEKTWRQIEEFFISKGLFITEKAKKLIEEAMR